MTYDPREKPLATVHAVEDLERQVVLAEDAARTLDHAAETARRGAAAARAQAARLREEIGRRLREMLP